ncbi:MAG: response regulator [Candidatus Lernaella stagnicola]|nr:response regulator [Candidatus Lernaella stagnicola]
MVVTKILIIEFNAMEANTIAEGLYQQGFATVIANSGHDGLRMFFEETPDLVLVNLVMPDIQGTEIVSRIRENAEDIPIIAISQFSGSPSSIGKKVGATDEIHKPIDHKRLHAMITRHVGEPSLPPGARPPRPALARTQQRHASAAAPEEGMPPKGSLKNNPFHQLLAKAFRHKATGVLNVRDSLGDIRVSFQRGIPVFVQTEGFARRLARDRRVVDVKAREIRRYAANHEVPEQEAAEKLEVLPPEELADAVRGFHYSILRDLCRPSGEHFLWEQGDPRIGEPLDPAIIISLAAKRHLDPQRVRGQLEAKGRMEKEMYLATDPERLPDLARNSVAVAVIESAKQGRVLRDVLHSGEFPVERLEHIVYALGILKVITFNPDDKWQAPAAPEPEPEPAPEPTPEPVAAAPQRQAVAKPKPAAAKKTPTRYIEEKGPAHVPIIEPKPPQQKAPTAKDNGDESVAEASHEPMSDRSLLRMGRKLLKSRTYSKAQRCFKELLVRNGDEPQILVLFAQAASRNRFIDPYDGLLDSIDALRRALELHPQHTEARLELARIFEEQGEMELAIAELEAGLLADPKHTDFQRQLRSLQRRLARRDEENNANESESDAT